MEKLPCLVEKASYLTFNSYGTYQIVSTSFNGFDACVIFRNQLLINQIERIVISL